jgi:hypothetical protein
MASPRCRDCGGTTWTPDGVCKACNTFPTLGFLVADFIEAKCAIPDRDQVGEPLVLTDEQLRFLLWHYRIRPTTKFDQRSGVWKLPFYFTRGSQLVRPQKWGKGPFGSTIICAEGAGPAFFDGWDANGQPVGRPWATPVIQVTALAEDQTNNVWSALMPMIELGDFGADITDTGLTRINLPGGGRIEPVTSAAKTRLGQRITFLLQDQTESWTQSNGGRALADNQRRNIAGMGGRWLSTPNAWDPTEESVAQYTSEHEHGDVHHDDVDPPEGLSIRNKRERRRALKHVYGDSWWVDLDRIDAEIEALLPRDPAQAERWFLNRKQAEGAKYFDGDTWNKLEKKPAYLVPKGKRITLGVDGARFVDALAIVATEVKTGHQWPIGIWERPEWADDDYEHPMGEVDAAFDDAMTRWDVWRAYIDPGSSAGNITPLVEKWQGRYGEKKVIPWLMNRLRQTAIICASYADAIGTKNLTHSGDEVFSRHIKNTVRRPTKMYDDDGVPLYVLSKDRPQSPRKIDAASAAVLSWEARSDCVAAGEVEKRVYRARGFV